jgi:hypothetical protein
MKLVEPKEFWEKVSHKDTVVEEKIAFSKYDWFERWKSIGHVTKKGQKPSKMDIPLGMSLKIHASSENITIEEAFCEWENSLTGQALEDLIKIKYYKKKWGES